MGFCVCVSVCVCVCVFHTEKVMGTGLQNEEHNLLAHNQCLTDENMG